MPVYWSEQYTCDFSPYSRMFFTVKHIYLTLYIVYALRISPIYSVPPALARSARLRACLRPCLLAVPARVCAPVLAVLARVCAC